MSIILKGDSSIMEVTGDTYLFLSSLNEYLNVVKLQVEISDPLKQTQDGDSRLKGYIDVMKLLAQRGNEFEGKRGNEFEGKRENEGKVKESDGKLREGEQQLNHTLNITQESECIWKDKVSTLKVTQNKLAALLQGLSLKQDESARVLAENVLKEKTLEDQLRESESNLRMTEEKLREKKNKLKELNESENNYSEILLKGVLFTLLEKADGKGVSAFLHACDIGNVDVVKALVASGVDPNSTDSNGNSALIKASENGRLEVVKVLVEIRADINYRTKQNGDCALIRASISGHLDVVNYLIAKGADLNSKRINGDCALIKASENGYLEVVKVLVETGADINHRNNIGDCALIRASINGRLDVVKYLIVQGADLSNKNNEGKTPLSCAKSRSDTSIAKVIEEAGGK
eukprot:GHVR01043591.1.p1 GENE.GHVR01043591.1~~GHVR01043591.1.p1  ORF type:complete len:404 (+),score=71.33 GHVR01043591.1:27-1238(+)